VIDAVEDKGDGGESTFTATHAPEASKD